MDLEKTFIAYFCTLTSIPGGVLTEEKGHFLLLSSALSLYSMIMFQNKSGRAAALVIVILLSEIMIIDFLLGDEVDDGINDDLLLGLYGQVYNLGGRDPVL